METQRLVEKIQELEGIMIASCTNEGRNEHAYQELREYFRTSTPYWDDLPDFVRTHRSLGAFWPFIQRKFSQYWERRQFLNDSFNIVVERIQKSQSSMHDSITQDTLILINSEYVNTMWKKALDRRNSDPEGAITIARSLIETVIKHILDEREVQYKANEDLPALYRLCANELNLSPALHSPKVFKQILSGAISVVNGLGALRNSISDSHGQSTKKPIRPLKRHAEFAVNMSGAVVAFLLNTHNETLQK